jgi:hypothetical protein
VRKSEGDVERTAVRVAVPSRSRCRRARARTTLSGDFVSKGLKTGTVLIASRVTLHLLPPSAVDMRYVW